MTKPTRRQVLKQTGGIATGIAVMSATGSAHTGDYSTTHGKPHISTRGHYDTDSGELLASSKWDYDTDDDVPGLDESCDDDITIFVHGWHNDENDAHRKMEKCHDNLVGDGYSGTVVEYTWDSDTGPDWNTGTDIAEANAYAFASACTDIMNQCGGILRVVCHSLGARVVLHGLDVLDGHSNWEHPDHELHSVHLLGAAEDNEAPTWEWDHIANGVQEETTATFNYYSREDNTLESWYNGSEADQALGETGAESGNDTPCNYHDYDATDQVGNDHSSYLNKLSDEIVYHMAHVNRYDC
jgi:esterase/lipase superfamily enzyme